MSFSELASEYEKHKLIPAEYQGGRKTAGPRSLDTPKMFLKTLVNYFGSKRIRNITHADIEKFKRERLKAPVVIKYKDPETGKEKTRERPRSIASVNRELEIDLPEMGIEPRNIHLRLLGFIEILRPLYLAAFCGDSQRAKTREA